MIRQLKHFNVSHLRVAGGMGFAIAAHQPRHDRRRAGHVAVVRVNAFPLRPDATVISAAIPLYYIARNNNGFWLARDAEGRDGGLFLSRRSALCFASERSKPAGCATMVLGETLELDVPNQGSRLAAAGDAAIDVVERGLPRFAGFVRRAIAQWRKLARQLSRALASKRAHRDALERELFHGQYTLASKNDDDLPIA
jgi:hypothetical protein